MSGLSSVGDSIMYDLTSDLAEFYQGQAAQQRSHIKGGLLYGFAQNYMQTL